MAQRVHTFLKQHSLAAVSYTHLPLARQDSELFERGLRQNF